MSPILASFPKQEQLQLPLPGITSSISDWLDHSIRTGYGERFAGAFAEAGVERLSDLHLVDMTDLEKHLKDAGAKLVPLKQIKDAVEKSLSCPNSSRCILSKCGLGIASPAACKTPSIIDSQSPMASFFGETQCTIQQSTPRASVYAEDVQKSTHRVPICFDEAPPNLASVPCKTPKTIYFDVNCNALRSCKSPYSAYFDGDDLSFNMDLPARRSTTPLLAPAPVHAALLEASSWQASFLPALLQPATCFCQISPPVQQCAESVHDVMQNACQEFSVCQQTRKSASRMFQRTTLQKQEEFAVMSQQRAHADHLQRCPQRKLHGAKAPATAEAQMSLQMLPCDQTANLEMGRSALPANEVADDICNVPVIENVWSLSQDSLGCRKVQAYIDQAVDEAQCIAVAAEFQGRISEAALCPHANYVLKKLIETLSPPLLQPMIDELTAQGPETIIAICRHRYGCRIVESLLLKCAAPQMQVVVGMLLPHACDLCMHMYGNYVMQRVVEYGTESVRHDMLQLLQVHVASLGTNYHGSAVIGTFMRLANADEQLAIARALIGVNGLLATLVRLKHAKAAAESVLGLLSGEEWRDAHHQLYNAAPLKVKKMQKNAGRAAAVRKQNEFPLTGRSVVARK